MMISDLRLHSRHSVEFKLYHYPAAGSGTRKRGGSEWDRKSHAEALRRQEDEEPRMTQMDADKVRTDDAQH
jgi:hypothetical protein